MMLPGVSAAVPQNARHIVLGADWKDTLMSFSQNPTRAPHDQTRAAPGIAASIPHPDGPETMDTDQLARCALVQHQRFRQAQPEDTHFAYEILRRALVERDELAWEYLYILYWQLVIGWVQRTKAFARSDETSDYFANAAFVRFARAITPATFANFPTVSTLLQYLRLCVQSVVIDHVRAAASKLAVVKPSALVTDAVQMRPDEEALARISAMETWRCIGALVQSEAEYEIIYRTFVLEMQPGEIYAARRDLFGSVRAVYMAKRNILYRLRHSRALRSRVW
jgi:hypothetical protein